MLARQHLALKYLPFSLLMGCDFQEGFKARFNCLVLKDPEHSLAQKMALAEVSGQL